ncbi:hypothetical protein KCP73_00650 [Salmonella enterica subsp. enterica]|nr:hypothetical protein KCP73_00650 [Salmonella enterica subsp. enterica]
MAGEFLGEHLAVLVLCNRPARLPDLVKCRWIIAEVNAGGFLALQMSLSIIRMNIFPVGLFFLIPARS